MKKLIKRWRRLSGVMDGCGDSGKAFCACANELEQYSEPRSLKDSPPTPDDEHGEILVKGGDWVEMMVWNGEFWLTYEDWKMPHENSGAYNSSELALRAEADADQTWQRVS